MRRDIALFLGLVTIIGGSIVVAVFFVLGGDGSEVSDADACDRALPPQGESDISQAGFQAEDEGLTRLIQAATADDLATAESTFYGDVQGFTHNVDSQLRAADERLAKDLCQAVVRIEKELFSDAPHTSIIATEATLIRDLLRDAAVALGFTRPGE